MHLIFVLIVMLVNLMPAFAPPTWTIIVFFVTKYNLNPILIILLGVTGATIGRFILANYINWFSEQLFNKKQLSNLEFLGKKIGKTPRTNFLFTFLYSLTPLSSTELFVATGIAKIKLHLVLLGFLFGRLVSYTFLVFTTKGLFQNVNEFTSGIFTWRSALSSLFAIIFLIFFIFVDWRQLLENKKLKFDFDIWKWSDSI